MSPMLILMIAALGPLIAVLDRDGTDTLKKPKQQTTPQTIQLTRASVIKC